VKKNEREFFPIAYQKYVPMRIPPVLPNIPTIPRNKRDIPRQYPTNGG
jgi:hypothetical protein